MAVLGGWGWVFVALLLIAIPVVAVSVAASRRKKRIASGELVLVDRTNTLAVVGFVLSFFAAVPAVVLGHIALVQIRDKKEKGWGFAVAALTIGYVVIAISIIAGIIFIISYATR